MLKRILTFGQPNEGGSLHVSIEKEVFIYRLFMLVPAATVRSG